MGKTSVWLSEGLDARWRVTGLPLSEVIRRGLDAIEGAPDLESVLRRVLDEKLSGLPVAAGRPPARYDAADEYAAEPYEEAP